jgi:hypothetical protein
MPREDVNIKVSSDVAEAVRLWKAMQEGPRQMANEMESMGQKGKKSTKGINDELASMVGKWATIGASIEAAKSLLKTMAETQRQLNELTNNTSMDMDASFRRYWAQAGISDVEEQRASATRLLNTAIERKVTGPTIAEAAEQLNSSGLSPEVIEGGIAGEFIRLLTATNAIAKGEDPAAIAKAMVSYMNATGVNPNRVESWQKIGVASQNLFSNTNFQLADLERYAPAAQSVTNNSGLGGLGGGIDQLVLLSQMVGITDKATASTQLSNGFSALRTAIENNAKVKGLELINTRPEEVDMVGETWSDVQKLLAQRRAAVPEDIRSRSDFLLYGKDAALFPTTLLTPEAVAITESRRRNTANRENFERVVEINETGPNAAARQAKAQQQREFYDSEMMASNETIKDNIQTWMKRQNKGVFEQVGVNFDYWARTQFWMQSPEEAATHIVGRDRKFGAPISPERREQLDQVLGLQAMPPIKVEITLKEESGRDLPHELEVKGVERQHNRGGYRTGGGF